MKKLLILFALLLKLAPSFQNGRLTLTSGALMAQSMGDESTCFLICSATVTISAPCDMVTSIPCPGVTITSPPYEPPPPTYTPPPYIPPIPNPCEGPTADPCSCFNYCGMGTGPSTPPTTTPPTTPPPPTTPKAPPRVDCAGTQAEATSKATTAARDNPAWAQAISIMRAKLGTPGYNEIEHAAALDAFDSHDAPVTYQFTKKEPTPGGPTSVKVDTYKCTMESYQYTEAVIHSHPEGKAGTITFTPPSGADVYALAEMNASCPKLRDAYTVAYNGDEYVLHIGNQAKTTAFTAANPKATAIDPDTNGFNEDSPIGKEFEEVKTAFTKQGYSVNDAHGMAMAHVLSKYDTGITLLKKDSDGKYKQLTVTATVNGRQTTYTVTICQ